MYIIVAGGGLIGRGITNMLVKNKHDVVVIDIDKERCDLIFKDSGAIAIHGSATNYDTLKEAGIKKADMLLTMMRSESDNISCALLAKSEGVPKIIGRMRDSEYEKAYELAGIDKIVSSSNLLLNQIIMEVEQPKIRKITTIRRGKAEVYAIKIEKKSKIIGKSIKDIASSSKFPKQCVFMGIYKETEDDFFIPRGEHIIDENDTVFLISKPLFIKKATDFLTKKRKF
ncbi:MAG: potassium channel family protein [Fusobacteriota bacterium]